MFLEYYEGGRTCLGKKIYLSDTNHQNWARGAAGHLNGAIKCALDRLSYDESLLDTTIERLRLNLTNPIHYGQNKPGKHFGSGVPVVPDPRFTYSDLIGFGMSGEDGYKGFLRDCVLPESVPYMIVVAATCLLLIDDAIDAMDRDDPWYASGVLDEARSWFHDIVRRNAFEEARPEIIRQFTSAGGKARYREKQLHRDDILKEWATGNFNGNKSRCARWARNQFPIILSFETVKRWIREYETTTQQAK